MSPFSEPNNKAYAAKNIMIKKRQVNLQNRAESATSINRG